MVRYNIVSAVCLQLTGDSIYGLLTKFEVKMAGYWPSSFFTDEVKVHKLAKKRMANRGFIIIIIWLSGKFFLWDTAGSPEQAR